jgi:hypothetical protein
MEYIPEQIVYIPLMVSSRSSIGYVTHLVPASISFSPLQALVERVKKISLPSGSTILEYSDSPNGTPTSYGIAAKSANQFFEALSSLKKEGAEIEIAPEFFYTTLKDLQENKFLAQSQAEYWQDQLHMGGKKTTINSGLKEHESTMDKYQILLEAQQGNTKEAFELYRKHAEKGHADTNDPLMKAFSGLFFQAVTNEPKIKEPKKESTERTPTQQIIDKRNFEGALAQAKKSNSVFWLCKAKEFCEGARLSEFVDLSDFFGSMKTITCGDLFKSGMEELAKAAAACPNITSIELDMWHTRYDIDLTQGIAKFLANSKSIRMLDLGSTNPPMTAQGRSIWNMRINEDTILPIANALKTNTTIIQLDLYETAIGDSGVIAIFKAIEENPDSKISRLNLFSCQMTNRGAQEILRVVINRPSIKMVNVAYNNISDQLEREITCKWK